MKNNTLKLFILLLVLSLVSYSCSTDDECGENIPVDFFIKIKLISESGENLLEDDDFNPSLLKITDPFNDNAEQSFSQISEGDELLITFQALNMDSVNFIYDGEDKFYFGFDDIRSKTVNCSIIITNYKALKSNGDLICDCSVDQVLVITLDL